MLGEQAVQMLGLARRAGGADGGALQRAVDPVERQLKPPGAAAAGGRLIAGGGPRLGIY